MNISDPQGKAPATRPPPGGNFTEAPPPALTEDLTPAASTSAIHPSRLQAIEQAPPAHAYGAPSMRGGRGRGGFAAAPVAPRGGRGFGRNAGVTGENKVAPQGGMRSWGSTPLGGSPAPESASTPATFTPAIPVAANGMNGGEKKKKGKKGDKGGTGSKAGVKATHNQILANAETVIVAPAPPTTVNEDSEPSKKRKRDDSAIPTASTTEVSEKIMKRLRKNVSKLESTDKETISLSEYLGLVGKGKKDAVIDRDTVLAGLKVGLEGGKWVLSV